jgi:hypothetical protein
VGDLGDPAGDPAELLLDRTEVCGVDRRIGSGRLPVGHGVVVTEEGVGMPEGVAAGVALLPASAMTIDCHSWPYHGELRTSSGAAAATRGSLVCWGTGSASMTV